MLYLLRLHYNMAYMILVIYLVEAENQDLFIVGKEVFKHSIEFSEVT